MTTIVLCYPVMARDVERIRANAPNCRIIVSDQESVARELFEADIFCGHAKVPIDWSAVIAGNRLQWIQSSAAGLDHCLVPEVVSSDVVVSGASGLFSDQVAEQTLALVYGLIRGLPRFFLARQQRMFQRLPVDDLRLKDVAVLGCGGNGQRIAELLAPAVRNLVATDLFPESVATGGNYRVVHADQTDKVVSNSDLVICTLPLMKSTRGILDKTLLSRIRAGGYFVNTGRGQLVDEPGLITLLQAGHLRGAGLDVFASEPPPDSSPLWELDNVIMTPHVGAQSETRNADVTSLFCENLRRFAAEDSLINLVDKELGIPQPEHRLDRGWRHQAWSQS